MCSYLVAIVTIHCDWLSAVEVQMSLAPFVMVSWFTRNYCACAPMLYMSYAKTVPSRMKLTMKLTMREPASMTTDT